MDANDLRGSVYTVAGIEYVGVTMNSEKINDWLQVAGLAGVIGSLIFVGLQLKQAQAIALSDVYQNRTATNIEANAGAINSSEYLSGMSKIYAGKASDLTMPEAIAIELHIGTTMTMIENNHWQYQAGFLPEEHWERNLREVRCTMTVPFLREIIMGWPWRESFAAVLSQIAADISDDEDDCYTWGWTYPLD